MRISIIKTSLAVLESERNRLARVWRKRSCVAEQIDFDSRNIMIWKEVITESKIDMHMIENRTVL